VTRGRFLTLEGGEGAGKSTQAARLAASLRAIGLTVQLTREPGGSPGAEAIRRLLVEGEVDRWDARAEALLFAAARADHVSRLIRPALERGEWVVCDRFVDSSRAYQGGGGGLDDADIIALHAVGSGGLMPDRTFLFEIEPEIARQRLAARQGADGDRMESKPASYHARLAARFRDIAAREPERVIAIDANRDPEAVAAEIWAHLADWLP
jgi:dTMP kinase